MYQIDPSTLSCPRQTADLTLTLLSVYLRAAGGRVRSSGMVNALGQFGLSEGAARATLARFVAAGLLARQKDGRRIDYILTTLGYGLLAEDDRRVNGFGRRAPTADAWTFLRHTIPADRRLDRARLASRLRFLGFGSLRDATWIAPGDREPEVLSLIDRLDLAQHVSVFICRTAPGQEKAILSASTWQTHLLGPAYEAYVKEFSRVAGPCGDHGLCDREAFIERTRLVDAFRSFLSLDPELPDFMVPLEASRAAALGVFDAGNAALAGTADRYFRELAAYPRLAPDPINMTSNFLI